MTGPFLCLADLRGGLLESPLWDDRRQLLFACDIDTGLVLALDLQGNTHGRWQFGQAVTALGLGTSGALVVALARSVLRFNPDTGAREVLWNGFDEPATSRLNDGKVGPDGAFWVGSMDGRPQREKVSRLYRITADGTAEIKATSIEISNGLAWTADGRTMFHSDSRGPWIDRYDFDCSNGGLSNHRRIRELDEASGRPDGGACDANGNYLSAGVSAGVLNLFSPEGALLDCYPFPVPAPTMPCFCGPGLTQLAVTSHRHVSAAQLAAAPQSGGIFLARSGVAGAPVARMKGI